MALGPQRDSYDDEEDVGAAIFADINITPLTDLFLVMLVIFMLATAAVFEKAMERQEEATLVEKSALKLKEEIASEKRAGLEINLPSGTSRDIDPLRSSLVVTLLKSGELLVNGQKIKAEDLSGLFQAAAKKNNKTQIIIKADRGVNHGNVVAVMETARRWNLTRLAIATQSR